MNSLEFDLFGIGLPRRQPETTQVNFVNPADAPDEVFGFRIT